MPAHTRRRGGLPRLFQPARGGSGRRRRHIAPAHVAEDPAGEPAQMRGRPDGYPRGHRRPGKLGRQPAFGSRDRLSPGPGADAGLHRRAGGGRPRRHAQRCAGRGARAGNRQSAVAGGSRHRPLGDGGPVRQRPGVRGQRRTRDGTQRRALPVPALGPDRIRQLPRRAARHRNLPPGQPGIPGPRGVDGSIERQPDGLSRHPGRHRQSHHHDQWRRRTRLGRRRHRSRSRDARPAHLDAGSRGGRVPADRAACRRHHGDGPGAARGGNAAGQGRGREIRGVFRRRSRRAAAGRPRDHRQHGAGIRRDLRFLSRGPGNRQLSAADRPAG